MLLSFHLQLLNITKEQKLHLITYKLVRLFSTRSVFIKSFEHLNKVGVSATMDPKLEEQRSVIYKSSAYNPCPAEPGYTLPLQTV